MLITSVGSSETGGPERKANLDLLRAIAIVGVVAYHMSFMLPSPGWLMLGLQSGRFGVELFFVLSGWLIGGLFWREAQRYGAVGIPRFMGRRLLRTVPPYFAALLLAWLGSGVVRGERTPVGWTYFVFLQNYHGMTLLHPSWSLCVEEHFYLVAPLLMAASLRLSSKWRTSFFLAIASITPLCHIVWPGYVPEHRVETHLCLDGLILGVALAYVRTYHPDLFKRLEPIARILALPAAIFVLFHDQLSFGLFELRFGFTLTELSFAILLVAVVDRPALAIARPRLVYLIALCSYSVYLTHTLGVHVALGAMRKLHGAPPVVGHLLAAAFVFAGGALFYRLVEAQALRVRDVLVPKREIARSDAAEEEAVGPGHVPEPPG